MIQRWFPKSEFGRNVATLASGTVMARVIPIALTPILTRIYDPDAFGILALFLSIIALLSIVSTGKYELAIISPKQDAGAINLLSLVMFVSFMLFLLFGTVVLLFKAPFITWLDRPDFPSFLLYLIPFIVLFEAGQLGLDHWFTRHKRYKTLAAMSISQSGSIAGANLAVGLAGINLFGLIFGNIIGQAVGTGILVQRFFKYDLHFLKAISVQKMVEMGRTFSNFPKTMILSNGITNFYTQLPVLFLMAQYRLDLVGFYALATRLVFLPSSLLGTSIRKVFRQKAQIDFNNNGRCDELFLKVLKITFLISIIPFLVFFNISPDLFAFVLGEKWRVAGDYAGIICIASFVSFFVTPIGATAILVGRTGYTLLWNTSMMFSNLVLVSLVWYFNGSIELYIWVVVGIRVTHYLVDLVIQYRFSQGKGILQTRQISSHISYTSGKTQQC